MYKGGLMGYNWLITHLEKIMEHGEIVKIIGTGLDHRPCMHERGYLLERDGATIEFADGYRDQVYVDELVHIQSGITADRVKAKIQQLEAKLKEEGYLDGGDLYEGPTGRPSLGVELMEGEYLVFSVWDQSGQTTTTGDLDIAVLVFNTLMDRQ